MPSSSFTPSISRATVLCDGRLKATFGDHDDDGSSAAVIVLSRDARSFVVAAPAVAPTAAAADAPPTTAQLHATALALRRHRPLLAQALAVRNAHPPPTGPWRPYEPRWLSGGGGDGGDDEDDDASPTTLAAKAELAAACLGPAATSTTSSSSWWLDPTQTDLPQQQQHQAGGQAALAAAVVVWTPRETLSLLPPSSTAQSTLEAEARSSTSPNSILRTRMGGRFFEEEGGQPAAASDNGGNGASAQPPKTRLHASSALPERLKGMAVRLLQLRSAAVAAGVGGLGAASTPIAAAAAPVAAPASTETTTTTTVPGLGQFSATSGLVRAALADGILVHLVEGEARVTLSDGRLVVVPRNGRGGTGAAAFFGSSTTTTINPLQQTTPATLAGSIALAEDFGTWAFGGEEEQMRRREGAQARARLDALASAAARTADAFGFCLGGSDVEEEGDFEELDPQQRLEAVERTLRLNSDLLAEAEG
jgi:hypothetical protein